MNYNVTQNKIKILGKSKRKVQTISEKIKDKNKKPIKIFISISSFTYLFIFWKLKCLKRKIKNNSCHKSSGKCRAGWFLKYRWLSVALCRPDILGLWQWPWGRPPLEVIWVFFYHQISLMLGISILLEKSFINTWDKQLTQFLITCVINAKLSFNMEGFNVKW